MKPSRAAIVSAVAAMLVLAGAVAWWSADRPRLVTATFDPAYPETNANGDPILAVFEGRIPCDLPGCQRRKIQLVLYASGHQKTPTTYWLGIIGTSGNDRVVRQGTWDTRRGVEGYPEALVYVLDAADEDLRRLWRVNDDVALLLDDRMSPKAGNGAWGYMLSRYDAPYGPRTYVYTR